MTTDLLPAGPLLSAFLVASFILAITPGPGVLYVVTRSVVQGRRYGMVSVGGVVLGNLGNVFAASCGLAALFAISSLAFTVVKYAGALYLVFLGIRMWWHPALQSSACTPASAPLKRIFRDGFIVALLNPKTTIFFAAFLPQFLSTDHSTVIHSMVLGSFFVAIAAVTDTMYVLAAGVFTSALEKNRTCNIGRWLGGGLFIGLGIFTACAGQRSHQ
jgi:threonine/homoserine/homoserine lactone efflux protein